jgi:AcrR family transcriptional regulator
MMTTQPRTAPVEPKQRRAHATRLRLLDAAVDELLQHGYVGLTTQGVARRAGVSRGAQQNYFPHKATLVAEAVHHLALRQVEELRGRVASVPRGRARVTAVLDVLYEQYSGRLFAAVVELSLAARGDARLRKVITVEERNISYAMNETATVIFGDDFATVAPSWPTALSTIRGVALLKLLGHSEASVDRQWTVTRRELLRLLTATDMDAEHVNPRTAPR